jgi:NADPH:quinone reductase-like Zn-dependent oxidoreductase
MRLGTKVLTAILLVLVACTAVLAVALSHDSPCGPVSPDLSGTRFMRAAVHRCYGAPEVVRIETVRPPVPGDDDVLVRVHAASVNAIDSHLLRGEPYLMRIDSGWGAPRRIRFGTDFAGTVEAVGRRVSRFKPGDRVFGGAWGSFSQYVIEPQNGPIQRMPPDVTFEQAASVPVAGITALQAVRDYGKLQPGEKVLVNGAAGGVGSFAVQIAKALGADVTAVTSTGNIALLRSIGADRVIDYTREDFTRGAQQYDLIVDCGGGHSLLDIRHALTPHGIYVAVGKTNLGRWIEPVTDLLIKPPLLSAFGTRQFVAFISSLNPADLATLRDLLQTGKVQPVIDRRYPLDRTAEAVRYLETGHARGKVVITVD